MHKEDSLTAKKKIPFPSYLSQPLRPQLPLLFLSQTLLSFWVCVIFLPAALLLSLKTGEVPWHLLIHGVWTSFSLTPLEHSPSLPALPDHSTLPWKMAFSAPAFFSSPHSCSSFSLSSQKLQDLCALCGTPKMSEMNKQVWNLRLLFVHATHFINDLPKTPLPAPSWQSSSILSAWLGDDLRDRLLINTLLEPKSWQKA